MAMTNAINPAGVSGIPLADQQWQQQKGEPASSFIPILASILSGQKVDGITPRLAQELMEIATPDVLIAMAERGNTINPNWYQNYIQPGNVGSDTYGQIMNYGQSIGSNESIRNLYPEMARQAMSVWQEPTYQVGGVMPTYQQQLINDFWNDRRMQMNGFMYDPYKQDYVYNPSLQSAMASYATEDLDAPETYGIGEENVGKGGWFGDLGRDNIGKVLKNQLSPENMRSGIGLQGSLIGAVNEYRDTKEKQNVSSDLQSLTADYSAEQILKLIEQLQQIANTK